MIGTKAKKTPISVNVEPGTYFLTFLEAPPEIWLTNFNYYGIEELRWRIDTQTNWVTVSSRGFFQGTCMEDVVFNSFRPVVLETGQVLKNRTGFTAEQYEAAFGLPTYTYKPSFTATLPGIPELQNKCECGSESIGGLKHSTWCKKYENSN